jgi:PAS domain S-box-containing protein
MHAALERKPWDVVISDWSMPRFSAPAALAVLRATGLDLPFIIVSGTIGEDAAVEAMRAGAHDYVLKDKLGRLPAAIERELRECRERAARREAEAALRESDARFRRLAESGLFGLVIGDRGGRVLDANDTFLRMVGHSRDEVVAGRVSWKETTPPEWVDSNLRALDQLRATGVARPWEKEYCRTDGTRVPVLVGAATLDDERIIAVSIDLTERKQAEAGRRRAEEALRNSEDQLRQAQKMEAVGRLAGGVAHDFNNVLSVIMSCGEFVLEELGPDHPSRADVEEIRKAASRAAGLTRQLLLFSRQQVVEATVLDLQAIVGPMEKMFRRLVGEDVELVVVPPESPGRIEADRSHIEQVILNLVVNARDAMPRGGHLTIETANVVLDAEYARTHLPAKAGPYVMLRVTDTGIGMDRETQARIFEPFFTTKDLGKGTGLGLSTVFGIVQKSAGHIWVESEPGKGATFKVYFPRVEADAEEARAPAAPSTLRGTETILLVEDEPQVRATVLAILRRQGYRVLVAEGAAEALHLAENHPDPIDLLLTDVVMPKMSGPELAGRLQEVRPGVKVLCMSGYTDDSVFRHGFVESAVAFILKPLTPESLTRKVREVLEAKPDAT